MLPSIDDKCGAHLRYRDLIECGPTWHRTRVANIPQQLETYAAMASLCICVLDPIIDQFGRIVITFGFVSAALDKEIRANPPANTTRQGDQHAGCERNRNGKLYCERRGQGVDLRVSEVGSLKVARWVVQNTSFDRLYFYGDERPFHVSHGPEQTRMSWHLPKEP